MPELATPHNSPERTRAASPAPAAGDRLDGFELAVLACLGAVSLAFLAAIFVHGGIFGGWEGFVVGDQGQYLSWIREAGEHVLIGNPYDLRPDSHVFLQPLLLISGLLYALGLSAPLAYLFWKPVGVGVLFLGVLRYTRRMLEGRWERRLALVLALFFVSPVAVISPLWGEAGRGTFDFISGEFWPAGQFWGYVFAAITIGLTPLVLLWTERGLRAAAAGAPGRRELALAAAGALLVSWLHPWQGATLVGILLLAGLWHLRAGQASRSSLVRALWPALAGAGLPAAYYFVLSKTDASWRLSEDLYRTELDLTSTWRLALALAPLALPALLGYRGRATDLQERMLRLWVPAGLLLYLFPSTPVRFHALNGLSIPLAILAVRGLAPYAHSAAAGGRGRLVAATVAFACFVVIVPGTADRIRSARGAVYLNEQPYHLDPGERDAMEALERAPGAGGVLTTNLIGSLVPSRTGRETYVGTASWTPDFGARASAASSLLSGRLTPAQAQDVVRSSGARFVFADCRATADLSGPLRPLLVSTHRYGCASVYELRAGRR